MECPICYGDFVVPEDKERIGIFLFLPFLFRLLLPLTSFILPSFFLSLSLSLSLSRGLGRDSSAMSLSPHILSRVSLYVCENRYFIFPLSLSFVSLFSLYFFFFFLLPSLAIMEGEVQKILCPDHECDEEIPAEELEWICGYVLLFLLFLLFLLGVDVIIPCFWFCDILPTNSEELYQKYQRFLRLQELRADPRTRWCPTVGCENGVCYQPEEVFRDISRNLWFFFFF